MPEATQTVQEEAGAVAARLAREKALSEAGARKKQREKLDGGAKVQRDDTTGKIALLDGRRVRPAAAFKDTRMGDFTHVSEELIKSDEDGPYVVRWIRHLDNAGNPSRAEMERMQLFGYEVIRDANGPLVRDELTAMQAPASHHAAYLVKCAKPGSMVMEEAADQLKDVIRDVNKKAGRRVVDFVVDEQDGIENPWP